VRQFHVIVGVGGGLGALEVRAVDLVEHLLGFGCFLGGFSGLLGA